MIRTRLFSMGIAAAACLSAGSAMAADYYFDSKGGNDSNDGKTEATAKATLKLPSETGATVYLKRGSSWAMTSLNARNVTVKAYGDGDRPAILGSISVSNATIEGIAAKPPAGGTGNAVNGINANGGSTIRDCEVDGGGSSDYRINVGIGVMGQNNRLLGNYIHDLAWSQSGGEMDNSGGAEGVIAMASNNEIAYNSAVRCSSANSTLGGYEGGCYEIVNGKAGATISNVSFHHNYCEQSIGTWEGCSGDFSATGGGIQENHGIIENVTVSYNLSVDSMWIFLLQPVNTDFRNVVFANNALIHTAKSEQYWDKSSFHYSMGNAVATYTNSASGTTYETDNEYYKKGQGFQPGTIIVKNNLFIDQAGSKRYTMFSTSFADHYNNVYVPKDAALGSISLGSTEKKVDLIELALDDNWRITAKSAPLIDQGVLVDMTTDATLAQTAADPSFFGDVFNQDYDFKPVPCGSVPDIGPFEYCEGMEAGVPASRAGSTGAGGSPKADGGAIEAKGGGVGRSDGGPKGVGGGAGSKAGGVGEGAAKGDAGADETSGTTHLGGAGASEGPQGPESSHGSAGSKGSSENSSANAGSARGDGGNKSGSANGEVGKGASNGSGELPEGQSKGCSCRVAGMGDDLHAPGTAVLLALGLLGLGARRRR